MKKGSNQLLSFDDFLGTTTSSLSPNTSEKIASSNSGSAVVSTPIYSGPDEELQVCCKRVLKKDEITRFKALKDIDTILQSRTYLVTADFIPFFSYLFARVSFDPSHKCREQFGQILNFIVQVDKKLIRTIIQSCIGYWWQLISDPIITVSQVYETSLQNFLQQVEVYKRYLKFTPTILNHLQQYIFIPEKEFYNNLSYIDNNSEENYFRVISSNLNGLMKLIQTLEKLSEQEPSAPAAQVAPAGPLESKEHSEIIFNFLKTYFTYEKFSSTFFSKTDTTSNNNNKSNKNIQKHALDLFLMICHYFPNLYSIQVILLFIDYLTGDSTTDHLIINAIIKLLQYQKNKSEEKGDISRLKPKEIHQFLDKLISLCKSSTNLHAFENISPFLLSIVANLPIESFGVYFQPPPAPAQAEENEINKEKKNQKKESNSGSFLIKNFQLINMVIDLYIENDVENMKKKLHQYILGIQLLTYLLSKLPPTSQEQQEQQQEMTKNSLLLMKKLSSTIVKVLTIYLSLDISDYSYGPYFDNLIDLGKCCRAIHKITITIQNETFQEIWNNQFWQFIEQFLTISFLSSPIMKLSKLIMILFNSATNSNNNHNNQSPEYSLQSSNGMNKLIIPLIHKLDSLMNYQNLSNLRIEDLMMIFEIFMEFLNLEVYQKELLKLIEMKYFIKENIQVFYENQFKVMKKMKFINTISSSFPHHFINLLNVIQFLSLSFAHSFIQINLEFALQQNNSFLLLQILFHQLMNQQKEENVSFLYPLNTTEQLQISQFMKNSFTTSSTGEEEDDDNEMTILYLLMTIVQLKAFESLKKELISISLQNFHSNDNKKSINIYSKFLLSYYFQGQSKRNNSSLVNEIIEFPLNEICYQFFENSVISLMENNSSTSTKVAPVSFPALNYFQKKISLFTTWEELLRESFFQSLSITKLHEFRDYLLSQFNQFSLFDKNQELYQKYGYSTHLYLKLITKLSSLEFVSTENHLPNYLQISFWNDLLSNKTTKTMKEMKIIFQFFIDFILPELVSSSSSFSTSRSFFVVYFFTSPIFLVINLLIYLQEQNLEFSNSSMTSNITTANNNKNNSNQQQQQQKKKKLLVSTTCMELFRNFIQSDKNNLQQHENKLEIYENWIRFACAKNQNWKSSTTKEQGEEIDHFWIYLLQTIFQIFFPNQKVSKKDIKMDEVNYQKNQIVSYLLKRNISSEEESATTFTEFKYIKAQITSIHRDEGSDHAYYSIQYEDDQGMHDVQTNFMRLTPLDFSSNQSTFQLIPNFTITNFSDYSSSSSSSSSSPSLLLELIEKYFSKSFSSPNEMIFQCKLVSLYLLQQFPFKMSTTSTSKDFLLLFSSFLNQLAQEFSSLSLQCLTHLFPIFFMNFMESSSSNPCLAVVLEIIFMKLQIIDENKQFKNEIERESFLNGIYSLLSMFLQVFPHWNYLKNYLIKIFMRKLSSLPSSQGNQLIISNELISFMAILWSSTSSTTGGGGLGGGAGLMEIQSWEYNLFHEMINYFFSFPKLLHSQLAIALHAFLDRCLASTATLSTSTAISMPGAAGNSSSLPFSLTKIFEKIELSEDLLYPIILRGILPSSSSSGSMNCHLRDVKLNSIEKFLVLRIYSYLPYRPETILRNNGTARENIVDVSPRKAGANDDDDDIDEQKWMDYLHPILKNELFHSFEYFSTFFLSSSLSGDSSKNQQHEHHHFLFLDDDEDNYELEIHEDDPTTTADDNNHSHHRSLFELKLQHLEKKFQFLISWLLFLFTIESLPTHLGSSLKSSFNKFSEQSSSSSAGGAAAWFPQLMHFLIKWSNLKKLSTNSLKKFTNKYSFHYLQSFDFHSLPFLFEELSKFQKEEIFSNMESIDCTSLDQLQQHQQQQQQQSDNDGDTRSSSLEFFNFQFLNLFILSKTILIFPSLFRSYWTNHCTNRLEKDLLLKFVQENIRIPMLMNEIQKINLLQAGATTGIAHEEHLHWNPTQFQVIGNINRNEILASLMHDESKIELVIDIPLEYPLKNVDIQVKQLIGIPENKWLRWKLMMIALINSYDKSIIEAILWWKSNMEKELEGIEPCIICYSVIHSKNSSLPSISCPTCKNKFHSTCLYTWFKTSGKNKCVLCQQQMV